MTYTWTPVGSSFYRSLPYTQNFESWSNLFAVKDNPGLGILTLPATGNASWRNYNETTANSLWSSSSGAVVLTATQGSGAASFYNYGAKSGSIGYMDFYLDLSASGAKTLAFDLINKDPGTLALQLSTDGGVTFSPLTGYTTTAVSSWTTQTVSLGSSTSSTCILRFRGTSTYNTNNIGLDNVNISIISCAAPMALSTTVTSGSSANFSWTAASPAPASGYEYFISTTNTAPASTTTATGTVATGTSVTVSGLTSGTTYYYWVRSVCSVSDKSTWTSGGSFKTALDLCGQSFYDSGSNTANYANNENITTVICPTNSTQLLNVTFNSFSTEGSSDYLKIYRGIGIAGTALHTGSGFSGTTSPGTVSGNTAGTCLTFVFTSDGSVVATGWDASVTCLNPCSGTPTAGTITPSRNPLCSGFGTTLTLGGATAAVGITYQWKSSTTAGGPYTSLGTSLTQATGNLTATTYYVCDVVCTVSNTTATAAEVTVTVNPNPTITATSSATQYCGTPLALNASGADTYSWSPSTNLSSSAGSSVTAILTANRNYTVVGTVTATGCTATSAALPLTLGNVIAVSSITASPNNVCSGTTSNLSVVATSPQTVNLYTFASSTGASLDPMAGATTLLASGVDNTASALTTFPSSFIFPYEGINYTQFSTSDNGVLKLGSTLVGTTQYNSITGQTLLLSPAGADMGTGTDGGVSYLLTGTAPNRIFIVQHKVRHTWSTTLAINNTFQTWLYETSGKIEYIYGAMASSGTPAHGIGISGALATNYQSINVATSTSSKTAITSNTTLPASGTKYTFTPLGPLTYNWVSSEASTSLSSTSVSNPTATMGTASTNFIVTISEANGCSITSAVSVTLGGGLPAISLSSSSTSICYGSSATLSVSPSLGCAPYTYLWSTGGTTAGLTVSPTVGTSYEVTVTDNNGSTISDVISISVSNPVPSSVLGASLCTTSGTLTLSAVPSDAANKLRWFTASSGGTSLATGTSFTTPAISTTTNYWVEEIIAEDVTGGARASTAATTGTTASNYGLVFTANNDMTINTVDVYSIGSAGNCVVILQNSAGTQLATKTIAIGAGNATTPVKYSLNLGFDIPAGTGYRLFLSSSPSLVREASLGGFPYALGAYGAVTNGWFSGSTSTTYYYFYNWSVTAISCKGQRQMVTATINTPPSFALSSSAATICSGSTAQVTVASGASSYDTYSWSPSATVTGNEVTGWNFNPTATTSYALSVSQSAGSCSQSLMFTVTVNTPPSSPVGVTVCQGSASQNLKIDGRPTLSSTLSLPNVTTSNPTYMRSAGGTAYSASTTVHYTTYTIVPSVTGSYIINGCADGDTHMQLYQNTFTPTSPSVNFVAANDDSNTSCTNDPRITATLTAGVSYIVVYTHFDAATAVNNIVLTFSVPSGAVLYGDGPTIEWYTTATGGTSIGTGYTFNPVGVANSGLTNTNTPGTTIFYAQKAGITDCRTALNFVINPVTQPVVTPSSITNCSTVSQTLSLTNSASFASYLWSTAAITSDITVAPTTNTTYTVVATAANGCTTTTSAVINIGVDINADASLQPTATTKTLTKLCDDVNGWTYYADPANLHKIYFGIKWGSANTAEKTIAAVETTKDAADYLSATGDVVIDGVTHSNWGTWVMGRIANVTGVGHGSLTAPVDVRFFYSQTEYDAMEAARASFVSSNGVVAERTVWFKTVGKEYDFAQINANSAIGDDYASGLALTPSATGLLNGVNYVEFSGITAFSGFGAATGAGDIGTTPLPITLTYFKGNKVNKTAQLSWRTETEKNNSHFEVQRSNNGLNFEVIGKVSGVGTTQEAHTYEFVDKTPLAGLNYYRLRQVDFNGTSTNSNVINLTFESSFNATLLPNPYREQLKMDIYSENANNVLVQVYDLTGRLLSTFNKNIASGRSSMNLETSNEWAEGTYVIRITSGNNTFVQKITKSND